MNPFCILAIFLSSFDMITNFFFLWPVNVTDYKNSVQMLNQPCIPEMEAILCAILNE